MTKNVDTLNIPWIDPVGGLGDTLMLSGVLKQVIDINPEKRFNLVRRTKYTEILKGHPAIVTIGHPPPNAVFLKMTYWDDPRYRDINHRSYQILASMFGLPIPVEETMYVPWEISADPRLKSIIPWNKHNVLICPGSDGPRKQMSVRKWESLVKLLADSGILVVQAGTKANTYIRGAYSLLGMTTPRQAIGLIGLFDAVITSDNFIMHAAHLCAAPAVVIWGPTKAKMYGYKGHSHFQATPTCSFAVSRCIGPGKPDVYGTICPEGPAHCMNQLSVESLFEETLRLVKTRVG